MSIHLLPVSKQLLLAVPTVTFNHHPNHSNHSALLKYSSVKPPNFTEQAFLLFSQSWFFPGFPTFLVSFLKPPSSSTRKNRSSLIGIMHRSARIFHGSIQFNSISICDFICSCSKLSSYLLVILHQYINKYK